MTSFPELGTYLSSLKEDDLRQVVVLPLLRSMGLRDVIEYHGGSAEKGKDVICWYSDPMESRRYVAVVIKSGDIHGSVSKPGSAGQVLLQVEQALREPYTDIYSLKEVEIDEVWVVTSGRIKNTAVESIRGKLKASGLGRLIHFLDREALGDLIKKRMPTFWYAERVIGYLFHDLRSPLSIARNNVRLLQNLMEERDRNVEAGERFEGAVERISVSLELLANVIDRGDLFLTKDFVSVRKLVRFDRLIKEAVGRFGSHRTKFRTRLALSGEADKLLVAVDEHQIRIVLFSLLDNAISYSAKETPRMDIESSVVAGEVILRVRDFGMGVSKEDRHRIFRPFFRSERAIKAKPGGLGQSLFLARRIARQHDGDLSLTNPEKPTEFTLVLPVKKHRED